MVNKIKTRAWEFIGKRFALVVAIIVLLFTSVVASALYVANTPKETAQAAPPTGKPAVTAEPLGQAGDDGAETPTTPQPASRSSETGSGEQSTAPQSVAAVPFQVSTVIFAKAPVLVDSLLGKCVLGQRLTYTAAADITATAAGTAIYHWELSDHSSGSIQRFTDEAVEFSAAGTKTIEKTFTYTVRDAGNAVNLWNRQYVNAVVTAPNQAYAQQGEQTGGSPFVWGTYIDLC